MQLLTGVPSNSTVQAQGCEITTVEGLAATTEDMLPIQNAMWELHGLQCGFCTPGMILASVALLTANPDPTEEEVRWALSGNLCRCTGYANIVRAVQWAAEKMKKEPPALTGMGAILAAHASSQPARARRDGN